ncbi:F-box domain-containing protein [Mycena kentingensis (nom. inval.)]|nr:F-box domain-containing protein [Mycena kentingensis (nom. inval.)]
MTSTTGELDEAALAQLSIAQPAALTLPPEIVAEIFSAYLDPLPALLGAGSPIRLGQICRLWRDIAHGTPTLWAAFRVFDYPETPDNTLANLHLSALRLCVQRSSSAPLAFEFGAEDIVSRTQYRAEVDAITLLLEQCARWRHVVLHTPRDLPATLKLADRPMPQLVHLELSSHDPESEAQYGCIDAPLLRTALLRLSHDDNYFGLLSPRTWANLTTLKLRETYPNIALCILAQTPALEHCWLTVWQSDRDCDELQLQLPRRALLSLLSLPALECFAISEIFLDTLSPTDPPDPIQQLAAVLKQWGCPLKDLCILTQGTVVGAAEAYSTGLPTRPNVDIYRGRIGSWTPSLATEWGRRWLD